MNLEEFERRAAALQEDVDRLVASGMTVAGKRINDDAGPYEWQQSLKDLRGLAANVDGFYDRPAVGIPYGFRYHLRRVNPLVRYFADRPAGCHHVIDVGSGTGAVAWAIGIGALIRSDMGLPASTFVIHEFDSSAGMLAVADDLWETLTTKWPIIGSTVERRPSVANWVDASTPELSLELVASYLFDHSDQTRAEEVGRALASVMGQNQVTRALFVSNTSKLPLVKAALRELQDDGWIVDSSREPKQVWAGTAAHTSAAQKRVRTNWEDRCDLPAVQFSLEVPRFHEVRVGTAQRSLPMATGQILNREQTAVAQSGRPARLVVGTAGSGKSLVLAEIVARHLERSVSPPEHLLVTTFNKSVVNFLHDVIADRFDSSIGTWATDRRSDGRYEYREAGRSRDSLTINTWDGVVSHHLGETCDRGIDASVHRRRVSRILDSLRESDERWRRLDPNDRLLDPDFYEEELRLVMYGLGSPGERYLEVKRVGREVRLPIQQREMVREVLTDAGRPSRFLERRAALAETLGRQAQEPIYDALFIDEGQDFLPADYEIAYALTRRPATGVIVVDDGQAVHSGAATGHIPALPGRLFERHQLSGSYRLPASIAQALVPLAETIRERRATVGASTQGIAIPESRKASVVGVRPILIVGNRDQLAQQIVDIQMAYRPLLSSSGGEGWASTILENDEQLAQQVELHGGRGMTNSVLKIKGRERPMIVWSTRTAPSGNAALETAYTAMTRATTILVLAVDLNNSRPDALEAIRLLDDGYVMAWNRNSAEWAESELHDASHREYETL